ncbi:Hypothetical protein CINCED_3A009552 [Cinara cedri]|uniref:Uncharacterized protein n=1 Tax=Cinara cedri TaxID=506608 RepID=A0A5E4MNZ2_9HEMI|nr:Hypothetical protein CINCED_3A009552 [Cinara cedri]
MDVSNLDYYPMYILNVIPELSDDGNVQIPQQILSNGQLPYSCFIPNTEHHITTLSTENVQQIVPQQNNNIKSIKTLSYEKKVHDTAANNDINFKTRDNKCTEKSINDLSLLLKDEDINDTKTEVIKYDAKTDTNVIFHLVRPSDLEVNPTEIKVPKRGRPKKNETKEDISSKQSKPEDTIEYTPTLTKSGRLCKPPKHLLNGDKISAIKKNSILNNDNDIVICGRKKVKYNVKTDFVCGGCGKIYLGHKRIQEHLDKFPTHKMNASEHQIKTFDSVLQDNFQNLHEPPMNIDVVNDKKETHTQTEVIKFRHCGYIKSKKKLSYHLKQVMKHLKKPNLIKSLSETISVWDLLSCTLDSGNLQEFSKELNTLIINLRNVSKSLKLISKCESNLIDSNQMFIDDSLSHLFDLPKGSYSLTNIQNEYEIEPASSVWAMNPAKTVEPIVSAPQNLNHHSSDINLNLFDTQSSKVDFLLSSSMEESIMCVGNQTALENVNGLVSERLHTMSDHLHSNVPIIDYPITSTSSASNVSQPDSFMSHGVYEVFTNDLNLVSTTTEEFIKSLEQFEPLNDTDNSLSTETRMLDFEDLQHTFHTA